jgi:hypothetical protein
MADVAAAARFPSTIRDRSIFPSQGKPIHVGATSPGSNLLMGSTLTMRKEKTRMQKTSLGLIVGAAILSAASLAHAQSATPIEGTPGSGTGKPTPSSTTGAAPNSAAPKSEGPHMPGGNPDRAPGSTQTHEPPAK